MLEMDHPRADSPGGDSDWREEGSGIRPSLREICSSAWKWAEGKHLDYPWIVDPAMDEVVCSWILRDGGGVPPIGFLFGCPETTCAPDIAPFPGWNPRTVTRKQYQDAIALYMDRIEKSGGGAGPAKRREKRNPEHYAWLVRRLVLREHWQDLEVCVDVDEYREDRTVRRGVEAAATRCGIRLQDLEE